MVERILGTALVAFFAVGSLGGIAAEEACTGRAAPSSAQACRVAPRRHDAQEWLPGTPDGAPVTPAADRLPPNPVGWLEADAASIAASTATVHEFYACRNAGDAERAAALLTEAHLRRLAAGSGGVETFLGPVAATPEPLPQEDRYAVRSVEDFGRTVDGRLGAIVVIDSPGLSAPETVGRALHVFVEVAGRYLIDEVIPLDGRA